MTETEQEQAGIEVVDALRFMKQPPRFRTQAGRLVQYSDGWYLRYYVDDPDAKGIQRKKIAQYLCPLHTEEDEVERLQGQFMKADDLPPSRKVVKTLVRDLR